MTIPIRRNFAVTGTGLIVPCAVVVLLIMLVVPVHPLQAQLTRYVAITGNDQGGANTCTNEAAPCRTVGQAISVASSGDNIEIGAGAYTESLTINKSLSLNGAGQGVTIIQAHEQPNVSAARVINIIPDLEVVVTGVTIRHGGTATAASRGGGINNTGSMLRLTDVTLIDNRSFGAAGGMATAFNSVDTLINVIFHGNVSNSVGGGLFMSDNSNSTLINVVFSGNTANSRGGAIYADQHTEFNLIDVSFSNNFAESHGGGIVNYSSNSPVLSNIIFNGNSSANGAGGGMYNENSSPILTNVIFRGNHAGLGGGMNNIDSSPTLTNVIFSGNKADMLGGGMRNSGDSNPVLTNVTFSGNSAAEGGGMANSSAGPIVVNSIFWNNEGFGGVGTPSASIFNDGPPGPSISYSLVQGFDYPGSNNMDGTDPANDPLFNLAPDPGDAPTTTGDLRLQTGSPVIDMGDPDTDLSIFPGGPDNPVDLAGNPRVYNDLIDMGAYEYSGPTSTGPYAGLPETVELHQNYPNPFNPSTIIGYSLPEQSRVELAVFDLLGRKVAVLVEDEQPVGRYEIVFDASGLASGLYIYRLQAGTEVRIGRMTLLK